MVRVPNIVQKDAQERLSQMHRDKSFNTEFDGLAKALIVQQMYLELGEIQALGTPFRKAGTLRSAFRKLDVNNLDDLAHFGAFFNTHEDAVMAAFHMYQRKKEGYKVVLVGEPKNPAARVIKLKSSVYLGILQKFLRPTVEDLLFDTEGADQKMAQELLKECVDPRTWDEYYDPSKPVKSSIWGSDNYELELITQIDDDALNKGMELAHHKYEIYVLSFKKGALDFFARLNERPWVKPPNEPKRIGQRTSLWVYEDNRLAPMTFGAFEHFLRMNIVKIMQGRLTDNYLDDYMALWKQ